MPVVSRDKVAELKTCPHCESTNGLYLGSDSYGSYVSCLCGWIAEIDAFDPKVGLEERNQAIVRRRRGANRGKVVELDTVI
jgi:transcription initiation factor TFIIIB Brf1 subunit/transcription initiation factor TFIIB